VIERVLRFVVGGLRKRCEMGKGEKGLMVDCFSFSLSLRLSLSACLLLSPRTGAQTGRRDLAAQPDKEARQEARVEMEVDPKETGKRADSDTMDSCPLEATEIAAADPSEKASQGAPPLAVAATPNGSHTVGGLGVPEQSEEEYDDDDDDFEDEEGDFDS